MRRADCCDAFGLQRIHLYDGLLRGGHCHMQEGKTRDHDRFHCDSNLSRQDVSMSL